jgi:hypothetical protein
MFDVKHGLARRDVVAGRRDADILLEILLSEGSTRKLVGGERHPQHRWWAPYAAILVRMALRCRTMEAVNGARDHLRYLGTSHVGMSKPSVIEKEVGLGGYLGEKG